MSDVSYIPSITSETARELRKSFNASAVEAALQNLFAAEHPGLAFHASPLPDHTDGVGIEVTALPVPEELHLGRHTAEAELTFRAADAEQRELFAAVCASLPYGETDAGTIRFTAIDGKQGKFSIGQHHGIRKYNGSCTLSCEIDLSNSSFAAPPARPAMTREEWSQVSAPAAECALAALLDASPGMLPEECVGRALRVTGLDAAEDFTYRNFTLELAARAPASGAFVEEFSALAGRFPVENVSAGGLTFSGIWCDGSASFGSERIHERDYLTGSLTFKARAVVESSQGASELPIYPSPNRAAEAFDPAALERALAGMIAEQFGLSLNTELIRGNFPPATAGKNAVAAVRLTGVVSTNTPTLRKVQALLQIRTPHRDELFRKLLAFDAMFPRYDHHLGGQTARAILKRNFELNWKEESGRNMLVSDFTLEIIL